MVLKQTQSAGTEVPNSGTTKESVLYHGQQHSVWSQTDPGLKLMKDC